MLRFSSTAGGLALTLAMLAISSGGRAEDDARLEPGDASLFDGKDLTGWQEGGSKAKLEGKTQTPDGRFKVEKDAIVVEKDGKGKSGGKDLNTIKSWPKGFHLMLEFRAGLKAASGVRIRGQVLQLRDFIRRNEKKHLAKFKNDDWNTLEVVVRNDQLITTIDNRLLGEKDALEMSVQGGKTTATLNGKPIEPRNVQVRITSVAVCKCNGEPLEIMTNIPASGSIGLRAETGKFAFRRIRIKELE